MTETRERPYRCTCHSEAERPSRLMCQHGTRAELIALLREMATGWHHLCKDALAAQAADAAEGLAAGSFSVKVGHTVYSVNEKA
ncbi:hypothetical protein PV729_04420 [Streptomyces europaeiscabiei]|uniref:Uncharacterized protein n=1 Tax=Streptomyces europaeiscabiei TaxID=146819 RepID=A0ABU4N890_9ACTN|nr:hypothetical protein [Streptomyces europaeiscabiei]MDX3551023.1 hypothetical protein [Streptomyces europaeiscabiei]MDX3698417.1 hypothetical protein [Streptomyces europaeiscabiei]